MTLARKAVNTLREEGGRTFLYRVCRRVLGRAPTRSIQIATRHIFNCDRHSYPPHPYKIIRVNPQSITSYSSKHGKWESVGSIQGGTCDLESLPFEEMVKYRAVYGRFVEGKSWEETGIYEYFSNKLEKRRSFDSCSNMTEVKERYSEIDRLYWDMKEDGYDTSHHSSPPEWWQYRPINYVAVHVRRQGDLIFAGSGCHRLSIARILELPEIPVWVRARHRRWQKIRDTIGNCTQVAKLNPSRKPFLRHPDVQDLPL